MLCSGRKVGKQSERLSSFMKRQDRDERRVTATVLIKSNGTGEGRKERLSWRGGERERDY
jgi:hypothetical protein